MQKSRGVLQNKMKKLLIATDSFLPRWDGIARFLVEMIPGLKEQFEITIVAPAYEGKTKPLLGVKIRRVPLTGKVYGDYPTAQMEMKSIGKLIRDADIVWSQTIGPIGSASMIQAKKQGKKLVSFIHSIEWELVPKSVGKNWLSRWILRIGTKIWAYHLYKKCDCIIFPSAEIMGLFTRIITRKEIVNLGTNVSEFIPAISRRRAKEDIGVDPDSILIGFCGRIGREKDLPTLHKAFDLVLEKYKNVSLLIVGSGVDKIENLFKKGKVHLVGSQNNVVPYLQAMDIFVLPSLTETSSLSTMEAMSVGLPVLTTPVGYVKEYVKTGYNGYFFDKGDYKALAGLIEQLILQQGHRRILGKHARNTIMKNYRWQHTVKGIRKVLESL